MTKLEEFTKAALQGLCANPETWKETHHNDYGAVALTIAKGAIYSLNKEQEESI